MRYTVILVPETANGSVRKLRVNRSWLRAGLISTAVFLLLTGVLTQQYLRQRRDLVELPKLRAERSAQREQLERYSAQVSHIEGELVRVQEFERKLRVISDLPSNLPDPAHQAQLVAPPPAVGGGADDAPASPLAGTDAVEEALLPDHSLKVAPPKAEQAPAKGPLESGDAAPAGAVQDLPAAFAPGRPSQPLPATEALADDQWAKLHQDAEELARRIGDRHSSLEQLGSQLQAKVERLASTPSIWPTQGWVTSRFGRRISPFTGQLQLHPGLDIASEPGTKIVAPARGKVVFVGLRGPLGKTVVINHGFGIESTFGHTLEMNVTVGQTVERGQVIALVGSSGRSTGPHLHYGLQVNGHLVDPADYILN